MALALVGCVSHFELRVPRDHPSQPEAPSCGALDVPNPGALASSVQPDSGAMEMGGAGHGSSKKRHGGLDAKTEGER